MGKKTKKEKEDFHTFIIGIIFFGIIFLIILFCILDSAYGISCKAKAMFNNDSYCAEVWEYEFWGDGWVWKIKSHSADDQAIIDRAEQARIDKENAEATKRCYDAGHFINETFEIGDYGFNCAKIDYINDHLMDNFKQMDGGYISGRLSGLFSSGSVDGQMYAYVNDRVVATGKLVQNINYHLDCEDVKHNEQIDYFTEEEFVMYYVEECIE